MSETLHIVLGDGSRFDALVHGDPDRAPALPQASAVTIATKDGATVAGKPGAVIAFEVILPDGARRQVQAVTTVALLAVLLHALRGRYGRGGPEGHRFGGDNPFL